MTTEHDEQTENSTSYAGMMEAKQTVLDVAHDLLDDQPERVIKIGQTTEDDWRVVLEVVEREAVPNTQDVLGRYEFIVDQTGDLTEYSLVERYQRGDSRDEL